jgi:hypothetical protein
MTLRRVLALILVTVSCSAPAAGSPSPTAAITSTGAPPLGPSTAVLPLAASAKFGILGLTRDGFAVRPETDPNPIRVIPQIEHRLPGGFAVSNDGRYVAYWRPIGGGGDDLMLYDAASNRDPTDIAHLPDATGGPIAWADDDSGLAFASMPLAAGSRTNLSVLGVSDRTAHVIASGSDVTSRLRPLTWIRDTQSVSAIEVTPQGVVTAYVLAKESGQTVRFAVGNGDQVIRENGVAVDAQSRTFAYLVSFTCQDGQPGCSLIRYWSLADPQQATWEAQIGPDQAYAGVWTRPFSRVTIAKVSGRDSMMHLFCRSKSCGGPSALPATFERVLVRPDGSALIGASFDGGWRGRLISLQTGSDLVLDLTTASGGAPTASVTLDVATASTIHATPRVTPLLTDAEILAIVKGQAASGLGDRIDRIAATLDRGSFPFAGTAAVWTVAAAGQFTINTRGLGASLVVPCMIWRFNAQLGTLIEQRWIVDAGVCPV